MILLIDNYDSFSYNLYQLIGIHDPNIQVVRNNEASIQEIKEMAPKSIVISPGPGKPSEAGVCIDVVKNFSGKIPILGVCLGHQAIYEAYGGKVSYAKRLMHGKSSEVYLDKECVLFHNLPSTITVARYHSLAATSETLPDELTVVANTKEDEIMAVCHKTHPVYGLQFHPESILTPEGGNIIHNFLSHCKMTPASLGGG